MTLRPPPPSSSSRSTGVAALDYEIAQEQVAALGRAGRALEAALAALAGSQEPNQEHDQEHDQQHDTGARAKLVQEASYALWCYMVQREAIGLRDPRPVLRDYRVPAEVQNRMGVFGRR
jgi:hypothetical protein